MSKWAKDNVMKEDGEVDFFRSDEEDFDMGLALALLDICCVLAEFYDVKKTKDEIDQAFSLDEMVILSNKQLEANSKSDFLLRPLQNIIKSLELYQKADQFQNLVPSELMQKLGVKIPSK